MLEIVFYTFEDVLTKKNIHCSLLRVRSSDIGFATFVMGGLRLENRVEIYSVALILLSVASRSSTWCAVDLSSTVDIL